MSRRSQFNIVGTVVGVLFLQVVQTGLTFMGYEQDVQNIAQGVILVGAILISRLGSLRRDAYPGRWTDRAEVAAPRWRLGRIGTRRRRRRPRPRSRSSSSRGIAKEYPGVLAVDEVDPRVGGHQVVGLVGKNGAGKSTLIKVMAGAIRPTPDTSSSTEGGRRTATPRRTPARLASSTKTCTTSPD